MAAAIAVLVEKEWHGIEPIVLTTNSINITSQELDSRHDRDRRDTYRRPDDGRERRERDRQRDWEPRDRGAPGGGSGSRRVREWGERGERDWFQDRERQRERDRPSVPGPSGRDPRERDEWKAEREWGRPRDRERERPREREGERSRSPPRRRHSRSPEDRSERAVPPRGAETSEAPRQMPVISTGPAAMAGAPSTGPRTDKPPTPTYGSATYGDARRERMSANSSSNATPPLATPTPAPAPPQGGAPPPPPPPPPPRGPAASQPPLPLPVLPLPYRYERVLDREHVKELTAFHDEHKRLTEELDKLHRARLALSYETYLGTSTTTAQAQAPATAPSTPATESATPLPTPTPTSTTSTAATLRQALLALSSSERELEAARERAHFAEQALEQAVVGAEKYAKAASAAQAVPWAPGLFAATGLLDGDS